MSLTATRTFTTCGHAPEGIQEILEHPEYGAHAAIEWCGMCGAYRWAFNKKLLGVEVRYGEWHLPGGPDGKGIKFF